MIRVEAPEKCLRGVNAPVCLHRRALSQSLCGSYPCDDERGGEIRAAHQAEAPVGVAAFPPQGNHEGVKPPHGGERGV